MSVLSHLFRKNINREIPVTSFFSQYKVLADFQILVKCLSGNSNSLHRTKLSHCTDANTSHLLSQTKASFVKQSTRLTAESQEASIARPGRHICFSSTWTLSQSLIWGRVTRNRTRCTRIIQLRLFFAGMKAHSWEATGTICSLQIPCSLRS